MQAPNPYAPPAAIHATPQTAMFEPRLASLGARFQASLLDGVMVFVVCVPALIFLSATDAHGPGAAAIIFGSFAMLWIYQWYLVSTTGQTLGKRWSSIRIVKVDGSPVSFVSAVLLRSWVFSALTMLPLVGGVLALADILMIFGSERRTVHDHLAGTRVIEA